MKLIKRILDKLITQGKLSLVSPRLFIKLKYWVMNNQSINLKNPETFNEKLNWMKLNYKKEEFKKLVDKYEVRDFVKKTIGEEYLIELLGVWDKVEDIDFESLPDQFVLKCTHDNRSTVICSDRSKLDIEKAKETLKRGLKRKFYALTGEWQYKNDHPRIIAEKYMTDGKTEFLTDYKFYCFEGKPHMVLVVNDRFGDTRHNYYDMDFNKLPCVLDYPNAEKLHEKPENFDTMVELAKKLSKGLFHVRVDLYNINGKIYFSELTFYNNNGMIAFHDKDWEYKLGDLIDLKKIGYKGE